jgi:AraC-like DNA-binding protein
MSRSKMTREEYRSNATLIARRGIECHNAKLDNATVAMILRQHARKQRLIKKLNERYSAKGLARQLGLHPRTVEKVLSREGWYHVREDWA